MGSFMAGGNRSGGGMELLIDIVKNRRKGRRNGCEGIG